MLYRSILIAAFATLIAACPAEPERAELDEVPAYEPEADAGVDAEVKYADGDPEPIYRERDAAAGAHAPEPMPEPAGAAAPEPAAGAPAPAPMSEPAAGAPAPMPEPEPAAGAPAPAPVPPTSCQLASGLVLTCANQKLYPYQLMWNAGASTWLCAASDAPQCSKGGTCAAWHNGGTIEHGVCQ